jgi:hypothetical protein
VGDLLAGQLSYVFMVSILDAALLSWIVLRWYARSVSTLMKEPAGVAAAAPTPTLPAASTEIAARGPGFALIDPAGAPAGEVLAEPGRERWPRRIVAAYIAGAAVYALVAAVLKVGPGGSGRPLVAWFAAWWANGWLIVPTLMILLVLDARATVRLALAYLAAGGLTLSLLTLAGQLVRGSFNTGPLTNPFGLLVIIAFTAGVPLALILLTGWRRIRAVTPLALAVTLAFGFGAMFFREALVRAFDLQAIREVLLAVSVQTSAQAAYYGVFMLVALPVGWLAWRLLRTLAGAFERKRFSDVQLVVDCWWLIATAEMTASAFVPAYGPWGVVGGLAAFVAYRVTVAAVLKWRPGASDGSRRRLLLLRVFGYQSRTESLFDRVAERWRLWGPVQLIAGVDLAARTADPGDMLMFVGGRLADQYVAAADDAPARIARLDLGTDPDGRFRVNELYCRHDTWRPTLQALLDASDTVLMDLRSFSRSNAGCIFELEQIVLRVPADRIVLVCDKTTDLRLLGEVLSGAWTEARDSGRVPPEGTISIVRIERQSRRELGVLMRRLAGLATPARLVTAADLPASAG